MTVHAYTSFSFSYLNRARVLAKTLRRVHPDWVIWAVVTDSEPEGFVFDADQEGFDRILTANDLFGDKTAHGVLTALGSLLIIWVMVELMENEIRQLRGGRFKIQIFLGVALVALIRELLIASLDHAASELQYTILAGILALGIVYWLISRAESYPSSSLR